MRGYLYLLTTSFLWGTTFVAQLMGMDGIGPFTYGMSRYIIGFFVLLVIWAVLKKRRQGRAGACLSGWRFGLRAGCIMFLASALQQFGLLFTTAGKTAFITCLYIIFVPLFARLIGRRISRENWAGAFVALAGLYFLSVHGETDLNYGDVLALLGSFFWAFHILYIDRYAARADNIELSVAQLAVCAVLNGLACLLLESFTWELLTEAAAPILYAAVFSSGVAYTLQIMGQRSVDPAPAAVIMSLESVFAALAGWLILGERLYNVELLGCGLMLAGMLITQAGVLLHGRRQRRL